MSVTLPPCAVCGHVPEPDAGLALPRMTPELLFFRVGYGARSGAVLPDGRRAVLAGDLIVSLSDEEWRHYRAMVRHDQETARAMELRDGMEVAA